jgi:hypothetical protein
MPNALVRQYPGRGGIVLSNYQDSASYNQFFTEGQSWATGCSSTATNGIAAARA